MTFYDPGRALWCQTHRHSIFADGKPDLYACEIWTRTHSLHFEEGICTL